MELYGTVPVCTYTYFSSKGFLALTRFSNGSMTFQRLIIPVSETAEALAKVKKSLLHNFVSLNSS